MILFIVNSMGNLFIVEYNLAVDISTNLSYRYRMNVRRLIQKYKVDSYLIMGTDKKQDLSMRILEEDLTESNMCGNGISAISTLAKLIFSKSTLSINTKAGVIYSKCIGYRGDTNFINIQMGKFQYLRKRVINGIPIYFTCLAEPHAIIFSKDIKESKDVFESFAGEFVIRKFDCLGEKTTFNLNLINIKDRIKLNIRPRMNGARRGLPRCSARRRLRLRNGQRSFPRSSQPECIGCWMR